MSAYRVGPLHHHFVCNGLRDLQSPRLWGHGGGFTRLLQSPGPAAPETRLCHVTGLNGGAEAAARPDRETPQPTEPGGLLRSGGDNSDEARLLGRSALPPTPNPAAQAGGLTSPVVTLDCVPENIVSGHGGIDPPQQRRRGAPCSWNPPGGRFSAPRSAAPPSLQNPPGSVRGAARCLGAEGLPSRAGHPTWSRVPGRGSARGAALPAGLGTPRCPGEKHPGSSLGRRGGRSHLPGVPSARSPGGPAARGDPQSPHRLPRCTDPARLRGQTSLGGGGL